MNRHVLLSLAVALTGIGAWANAGITMVAPDRGPSGGGNRVTIGGAGLGSGSDITNVTLCGVAAALDSQSATQVVVRAGAGGSGTGDVVVCSTSAGATVLPQGYAYNPAGRIFGLGIGGWTNGPDLPAARHYLGAEALNGFVYAIGGHNSGNSSQTTVWRYDPSHSASGWVSVASLPAPRVNFGSAVWNGRIFVIGGWDGGSFCNTLFAYDPTSDAWQTLAGLPAQRSDQAGAAVGNTLYSIGGYFSSAVHPDVYAYDGPANVWTSIASLPSPRNAPRAAVAGNRLYSIGGGGLPSDVSVYDLAQPAMGWQAGAALPSARTYGAAVNLDGTIYYIGGQGPLSSVLAFDPARAAGGWTNAPSLPAPRQYAPATVAGGRVYVLGGNNGASAQSTVYVSEPGSGVEPGSSALAGGVVVNIAGANLGSGTDITNVTLCGGRATIFSQSSTGVVVSAGAANGPITGDVAVCS